jgi:citrate synthase
MAAHGGAKTVIKMLMEIGDKAAPASSSKRQERRSLLWGFGHRL